MLQQTSNCWIVLLNWSCKEKHYTPRASSHQLCHSHVLFESMHKIMCSNNVNENSPSSVCLSNVTSPYILSGTVAHWFAHFPQQHTVTAVLATCRADSRSCNRCPLSYKRFNRSAWHRMISNARWRLIHSSSFSCQFCGKPGKPRDCYITVK